VILLKGKDAAKLGHIISNDGLSTSSIYIRPRLHVKVTTTKYKLVFIIPRQISVVNA